LDSEEVLEYRCDHFHFYGNYNIMDESVQLDSHHYRGQKFIEATDER